MVKISKKPKRAATPHPKVNTLILAIQDAPEDELATVLGAVGVWHWPRTDLHYWIKPLNRFDTILEEICKDYHIVDDAIQTNEFTPRTKDLILSILRFTRLLLENATNRKLYASFDRMNDLLLTQDLDVLESTLRLIFRRAQQIATNGQLHSGDTFNLTPDRIRDLSTGWKAVRRAGLSMYDWQSGEKEIPKELSDVEYLFYRKLGHDNSSASQQSAKDKEERVGATPVRSTGRQSRPAATSGTMTAPSTPAKALDTTNTSEQEGLTTINLDNVTDSDKPATDILADAMERHRIPPDERLQLLQRIRVSASCGDAAKRRQMLRIRLLAISILVHTSSDSTSESTIFLFEPDFITQLADLVHPDHSVQLEMRTVAILALDTVSRVRNKVGEVTSALSVSVNHGIMMSMLRKLASHLHDQHCDANSDHIDALFNFLMHLQTTGFAGNMLLGAGIIPLLIDMTKEAKSSSDDLLIANRCVTFLDNFTYSFASAAAPFAAAGGLATFVERVHQLVSVGVTLGDTHSGMHPEAEPDTLSFPESTLLKSLFRCLQRLMGSGSNTEGVRNLIESNLVASCRLVMQYRGVFGPQNFALAINIMLTFVHNEPTSLGILQENKMPDAFYDAVSSGEIEPSLDVLSAIPTAIGALCLNEAGLNHFIDARLNIIDKFFAIFQSEKHARVLNERENAVVIGANFDELVRHHPSLKQPVFEAITKLLSDLYEKGKGYEPENPEGYRLVQVTSPEAAVLRQRVNQAQREEAEDVVMGDVEGLASEPSALEGTALTGDTEKKEDNYMLTCIAITSRFLEGFFNTPSHCKDYIKKDGLDPLLRLFTLPCIPYDIHHQSPLPGLTTVFMTLNEHSSGPLLKALLAQVKAALADVSDFWQFEKNDDFPLQVDVLAAKIQMMLTPDTGETLKQANTLFRALTRVQLLTTVLADLHSMDTYMSRQPSTQVLSTLKQAEEIKTIHDLCALQRACVLSVVRLKAAMPHSTRVAGIPAAPAPAATSDTLPTDMAAGNAPLSVGAGTEVQTQSTSTEQSPNLNAAWPESRTRNAKAIRQVLAAVPESLKIFFQGVMNLQSGRRSTIDAAQRKDATVVANAIALGVAQHLRWPATSSASENFEYSTLMVKFMSDLLVSDRASTGGLQLIFLKVLDKHEGMDRLTGLFGRYTKEAAGLTQVPEASRDAAARLRLIHAVGGLKVILGVFETLTSHKSLLSPGHLLLLTQDAKSPSFFDPHTFLVKLRARILPAISEIWNSEFLAPSPPIIVRAVFRIILHILEGQGEAVEGLPVTPFPAGLPARQPVQPDPDHVNSLIEMGFPRSACEQALVRRNNNLQTAADYLMSHPDLVAAARTREGTSDTARQADGVVEGTTEATAPTLQLPLIDERQTSGGNASGTSTPQPAIAADVDMADLGSERLATPVPPLEVGGQLQAPQMTVKAKDPAKKYSRADLDNHRNAVKTRFVERALELARDHIELVFDIRDALKSVDFHNETEPDDSSQGLNAILHTLNELLRVEHARSELERSIAVRVRLIALIFSDTAFRRAADDAYKVAMAPVAVLVQEYLANSFAPDSRPKWLAPVMLLAELILARSELPQDIRGLADDDEEAVSGAEARPILRGPNFHEERQRFFELCIEVFSKGVKDRAEFQSAMRLVLLLTRQSQVARMFVKQGGLASLMAAYDRGRRDSDSFQQYAIMILRHAVEDDKTVKASITQHIESWLARPRRANELITFTRDLTASACRDTAAFIDITKTVCELVDEPAYTTIVRKKLEGMPTETASGPAEMARDGIPEENPVEKGLSIGSSDEASKGTTAIPSASPDVESVMHFLLGEIQTSSTAVVKSTLPADNEPLSLQADPSSGHASQTIEQTATVLPPSQRSPEPASATSVVSTPEQPISQSLQDYTYSAFILTCIAELVTSYTSCKHGLLSYSKGRADGRSSTTTPSHSGKGSKLKPYFLHYLLSEVVPTGGLLPGASTDSRKRFALSAQAIGVVAALCSDPHLDSPDHKDEAPPEITLIRRMVLDAIAKAFKELTGSTEAMDVRYGRVAALCNLCARLLATPVPSGSGLNATAPRSQNELSIQMAKLMLEKNFATLLTSSLAEVDLNYPSVQNVINAILTPLEHLTKLVTKLGRSTEKPSPAAASTVIVEDSASEDEDIEDHGSDMGVEDEALDPSDEHVEEGEDGAEADVYRNSALGMFEGELEPANAEQPYDSAEEMDEDMEEWDEEDEEMMEEEGVVPSDVSDESDVDEEDEIAMAHEMRDALDDEMDESSSADENEDEDDFDDDGDADDDDGPEIGGVVVGELQDDLNAALADGHLEPVDEFTGQLINDQMDRLGEPDNGGLIEAWGDEGGFHEDEGDMEGEEDLDGDDGAEDDSDDTDEGIEAVDEGPLDVANMFQDLIGGPGEANVQVAVMGGTAGGEQPLLSIDLGAGGAQVARRTGGQPQATGGVGQHSLLVDTTASGRTRGREPFSSSSRHRHRTAGRGDSEYSEWVQSLEDMIGTGASQLLQQVFGNIQAPAAPVAAPAAPQGPGTLAVLQGLLSGMGRQHERNPRARPSRHGGIETSATNEAHMVNEAISNPPLVSYSTVDRWTEESAIFNGGMQASERINLIALRLRASLLPDKRRKEAEAAEKAEKERPAKASEGTSAVPTSDDQTPAGDETIGQRPRVPPQDAPPMDVATDDSVDVNLVPGRLPARPPGDQGPITPSASNTASSGERPSWRERVERRRQAQAAAQSVTPASANLDTPSRSRGDNDDLHEVLNLAARLSAVDAIPSANAPAESTPVLAASAAQSVTEASGGNADEEMSEAGRPSEAQQAAEASQPEAGSSTASERVTIQIRGNTVDITDTGIDPTFLEALPDEMREEVLNQHFRETRAATAAPPVPQASSSISSEFLDALPPELRTEVLAQEALERVRIARQEAAAVQSGPAGQQPPAEQGASDTGPGAVAQGGVLELDPAAFLATLDPLLRQTVLLEQGEEMLGALPPNLRDEYAMLRDREIRHHRRAHRGTNHLIRNQLFGNGIPAPSQMKKTTAPHRDAVQLLDKSGVAVLVRLLFFPPPLKKNALQNILIHLCENGKTRVDLINLLLTILHDGTKDTGAGGAVVDKTFSQMTLSKSGKAAGKAKSSTIPPATPGSTASPAAPMTPGVGALPSSYVSTGPGENIPNLVVQRSLEALAYLVAASESSAAFFLKEQELPVNLTGSVIQGKRAPGTGKRDKGKGKEREIPKERTKIYPIVILFALLDRESLTKTSSIMEALTKLLAHITMPLRSLDLKEKLEQASMSDEARGLTESGAPPSHSASTEQPPARSDEVNSAESTEHPAKTENEGRLITTAPKIPANYLKMVVNILDLGECSSKMFSAALGLIHNLWNLPEARRIVSSELIALAQRYGKDLIVDLTELQGVLETSQSAMSSSTLGKFSQASSKQAKILRVLKTLEHAKQQQKRMLRKRQEELDRKKKEAEQDRAVTTSEESKVVSGETVPEVEQQQPQASGENAANTDATMQDVVAQLETTSSEDLESERNKVDELYDGFDFSPLWTKLSDCLDVIERQEDVSNAGTLLPLIEAFLLVSSWGLENPDGSLGASEVSALMPAVRRRSLSPTAVNAVM